MDRRIIPMAASYKCRANHRRKTPSRRRWIHRTS